MALALVLLAAFAGSAHADVIAEIVVDGNTKTTTDTVELVAGIDTGDEWTPEMAETVRNRLVSSGLFKDVDVFYDPLPGGVRVHLNVKDKWSWVIAPAVYVQPTNKGGGIGYGENNLFGLDQKLLVYAQLATGDTFFIGAWVVPHINGSRFYSQLDLYTRDSYVIEYGIPTKYIDNPAAARTERLIYLNAGGKIGVELFRGVKLDMRLRGAWVGYQKVQLADGATIDQVTGDPTSTSVPAPGKQGWDISNEWDFTIDRRANYYGVYTGHKYNLAFEWSGPQLGSDFTYHRVGASLFQAWQVLERHNLIVKAALNVGHHLPFQQEFTMGGTSMRGWLNNQFRGDLQALGNLEYSLPLFTIEGLSFRGLGFWDSGYTTYFTQSPDRNYLPNALCSPFQRAACWGNGFKNSVGLGTRLYLRQIVLPLLGLDVGYGLEAGDVQVYLAIGLTD